MSFTAVYVARNHFSSSYFVNPLFFEDFKDTGFDKLLTKPYNNIEKLSGIINELIPGY
jgi:hypothetical protein